MRAASIAETRRTPAPSLRSGFTWTLAGNGLYAASQWGILSLTAKLGGTEMLGQYALAVALTTPVVMLAHLNLRAVLATDVDSRHPFGDYLAVRLWVSLLSLLVVAVQAAFFGHSAGFAAVIMITGLAQSSETISDIFYGAMQKRNRMDLIGRSMILRGLISVSAFGVTLATAGSLAWALAAMACARVAILLAFDRPRGSAGECLNRSGRQAALEILRTAVPLGLVLLLISLNTNLPRYAIERFLGLRELGVFAAVASFITAGATVANALGQSATPLLARHASRLERKQFLELTLKLSGWLFALGVAGMLGAAALGPTILRILYRPEFAAYGGLLVAIMGAATLGYVAIALGYSITAVRAFDSQVPLFCAVAATCGATSWLLVPRFGLRGAAIALALAAAVQIGGEALILSRALRRMGAAR